MNPPSWRSDLCASFTASPWTSFRSALVSRLHVSIFAFTVDVFVAEGDVAGLAIVAGLTDAGALALFVVLVSFELQPAVIITRQKTITLAFDGIRRVVLLKLSSPCYEPTRYRRRYL